MRPLALSPLFGREVRRIHCLGVGGMGVAPLAIYLVRSGWSVSGEDDALGREVSALLSAAGVCLGPMPAGVRPCRPLLGDRGQPSLVRRARSAPGLASVRRGEMLAEVARGKRLVAVCGSHGKTTTTAMLVTALRRAGFPAGYVAGGSSPTRRRPPAVGSNEWVVAEVDESDGTIDGFAPEITVIVNLDWDHPDRYGSRGRDRAGVCRAFARGHGARCW